MPPRYSTNNEDIDNKLFDLIDQNGPCENRDLIHQLMVTALKLAKDGTDRGDLKIMNSTLKEMRFTWKVFGPYRRHRKVSVFGSARTPEGHPDYVMAEQFSKRIADEGFMTITGGGNGIMKAGNAGAGRERTFGANIRLPFEQASNSVIAGDTKAINFKYFFTRKLAFIKESHAVVCFPGGFGTHDEAYESMTLIQTGKSHIIPVVLVHPAGSLFWTTWEEYVLEHLLETGLISKDDTSLYLVTDSVERAVQEVVQFYRRYHSSRYVGDLLVFRMQAPLTAEELALVNGEFSDLLSGGVFEQSDHLPQEVNDPHIAHLPRLSFRFIKRRFGRLRQLIDRINSFPLPEMGAACSPEVGEGGRIPEENDPD
ncbi:LOG family protein [bacterium]|nr:LOG family protein [bacterium]